MSKELGLGLRETDTHIKEQGMIYEMVTIVFCSADYSCA
jgi:hypothetical protein